MTAMRVDVNTDEIMAALPGYTLLVEDWTVIPEGTDLYWRGDEEPHVEVRISLVAPEPNR